MTVPYDSGVAFRISCEMPLAIDLPAVAEPLEDLTEATLQQEPPETLETLARAAVADAWDEHLHDWACETLARMRAEYQARLDYLHDALADVTSRGVDSLIAPHVARRLAERLAIEVQLQADYFDALESELEDGGISHKDAVQEIAAMIGKRLDVPSFEITAMQRRSYALATDQRWRKRGRQARRRLMGALATDDRRDRVRELTRGLADELQTRAPTLAAALVEAAEASSMRDPENDPLWTGAVRGLLLQHDAWRLDGPHLNDLHGVFTPL